MLATTDTHAPAQAPTPSGYRVLLALLPVVLALFVSYLPIGMQLPVLPLHLHDTLSMGTAVVGLVIGSQFVMALLSRAWAGNFADMRGAKRATVLGCLVAAASGVPYLASLGVMTQPAVSVGLLLVGRVVLALGESLIAVGVVAALDEFRMAFAVGDDDRNARAGHAAQQDGRRLQHFQGDEARFVLLGGVAPETRPVGGARNDVLEARQHL